MNSEAALRVGMSSILPTVDCHNVLAKGFPLQCGKLSRAAPLEHAFNDRTHLSSMFKCRSKKTSSKGHFTDSGKLYKTGACLWLPEAHQADDSRRQKAGLARVNAVDTMSSASGLSPGSTSRIGSAATAESDRLGVQSVLQNLHNVANGRTLADALLKGKEERMKGLLALGALRQGRILDSRVFRQTYVIRSYEVSADGTASIDTILNLFQEVALNHVSLLGIAGDGFGATIEMNRYRLIWVITRLHVEVERYPSWPEVVEIDSWTDSAGKNGMRRDWLIREHGSGQIIARATSTWVTMNQDTRSLSKLPEDIRTEIEPTFVKRHALGEETLKRIPKLLNSTPKSIHSNLSACRADLDGNHHINNVTYARWVMQSTPATTLETHELNSITLEYRRECHKDDIVESLTDLDQEMQLKLDDLSSPTITSPQSPFVLAAGHPVNGNSMSAGDTSMMLSGANHSLLPCFPGTLHHTHLLRTQSKGEEIVRGRTVWKQRRPIFH